MKKFLNAIKQPFAKLKAKLEEPTKEEQNWLNLMNELQKVGAQTGARESGI